MLLTKHRKDGVGNSTDLFTILKLGNSSIDVSELLKINRLVDFEALKIGWSGRGELHRKYKAYLITHSNKRASEVTQDPNLTATVAAVAFKILSVFVHRARLPLPLHSDSVH